MVLDNNQRDGDFKNYVKYDDLDNNDKDDGLGPCWKRRKYIEKDSQLLRQQCAATEREGGNYKEQNPQQLLSGEFI